MNARQIILLFLLLGVVRTFAVSFTGSYSQNFDGTDGTTALANSGTSSAVPAGWAFIETGTANNTTYTAGTGSATTGDTYSFGGAGSAERAFGGLRSGSLIPTIGVAFENASGSTITSLLLSYTGEQWRLGTSGRADRLDFQYSLNATTLGDGTWTDVNTLDFSSPNTATTIGALDGNAALNRTAISGLISGLNIAGGATFWLRWQDFDASGADDGLAVDDFALRAQAVQTVPDSLPVGIEIGILVGLLAVARRLAVICVRHEGVSGSIKVP